MPRNAQVRRGNRLVTAVTALRHPRRTVRRKVRQKAVTPLRRRVRKRPLFRCGDCGKAYNSPLGHVCGNRGDFGKRKRAAQRSAAAAARAERRRVAAERAAAARQKQRERTAVRLTAVRQHERAKADARVAKAKAARKSKPRPARPPHDYSTCHDGSCGRVACQAWREALDEGHRDGYDDGHSDGYREGERDGYSEGLAACARTHK